MCKIMIWLDSYYQNKSEVNWKISSKSSNIIHGMGSRTPWLTFHSFCRWHSLHPSYGRRLRRRSMADSWPTTPHTADQMVWTPPPDLAYCSPSSGPPRGRASAHTQRHSSSYENYWTSCGDDCETVTGNVTWNESETENVIENPSSLWIYPGKRKATIYCTEDINCILQIWITFRCNSIIQTLQSFSRHG